MINKDYAYTELYDKMEQFITVAHSAYFFGYSQEDRSHAVDMILGRDRGKVQFVQLVDQTNDAIQDQNDMQVHLLKSTSSMELLFNKYPCNTIYIDVSGLDNRICAALLNHSIKMIKKSSSIQEVKIIYAEPASYDIKKFKAEGVFNNLSEKIDGIYPLPGFATILPEDIDNTILVALLGFEGGRFTHILESIQPPEDNVFPVIGLPGFKFEYPFIALDGNSRPLEDTWRRIRYSAANSMVDIYFLLTEIQKSKKAKMKLAPIGTKPHAIGAMLFAIKHPSNVELVYDNPKRKIKRTSGIGKIVECAVSKLIDEN